MKKIIGIYTNWRADVLFAILAVSLLLLFSENETLTGLFATKLAALCCGVVFAGLYAKWETEGKLTELSDLAKEED